MDEFAQLLRAWRERVTPQQAGLAPGMGRRTPGLRREELALLAGVSVDYVVRLEQGRARHPSAQLLSALARALRLNDRERDHLFRSAGAAVPPKGHVPRDVGPSVQRIVDRLGDVPVGVHTASYELVLCNPLWSAMFGDPFARPRKERNLVWRYFTGQESVLVTHSPEGEEEFAASLVGHLRTASGVYPEDREIPRLVEELKACSPDFARRWAEASVGELRSSHKIVHTRQVGSIVMDCDTLAGPEGLLIVVMTAEPGSEDERKLELLRVVGLQQLQA